MKKNLFMAMAFLGFSAWADIPPRPGTVVNGSLSGTEASIVYDSLEEAAAELPSPWVKTIQCGNQKQTLSTGKLHISSGGKVIIACTKYYCYGHRAVCSLQETY